LRPALQLCRIESERLTNRAFLRGFSATHLSDFGLSRCSRILATVLAPCLCIQKFRSRRLGFERASAIYRRDLIFDVEYATVQQFPGYVVTGKRVGVIVASPLGRGPASLLDAIRQDYKTRSIRGRSSCTPRMRLSRNVARNTILELPDRAVRNSGS
jgi:hypothetical protein